MENLKLFKLKEEYAVYLHSVDHRVQLNKNSRRPYVGVVLSVNGFNYFVPMESPKPNHKNIKNSVHIMRLKNGEYGLLGFNNMLPARPANLICFNIADISDKQYRELLRNQIDFCNRHKQKIHEQAEKTYEIVTKKTSKFHLSICCDFIKLEHACIDYKQPE